jgi:fibronectin-binding autotransporter adhesin
MFRRPYVLIALLMCATNSLAQIQIGGNGANSNNSTIYSGTNSLLKVGSNTVTLTGNNSYTGGTTVDAGSLVVSNNLANNASNTVTVNSGGSFVFARDNIFANHGGTIAPTMVINSGGFLQNTSSSFNTLGAVTMNGGTLQSTSLEALSGQAFALKGTVTVNGDTTSTIAGNGIALGAAAVTGTTFAVNNGAAPTDLLVSGVLRDGAGNSWPNTQASFLTKTGAGVMVLVGSNTYSGTTTISAGTLQVGNGGATGTLGSGNVVNNASLVFNRSNAMTVANTMSGSGSLTQIGTGTTTLTGNNSYTGGTSVNAGTLVIGTGGTLANVGTNILTIGNGATVTVTRTDFLGAHNTAINMPIIINEGGLFQNSGAVFNSLGAITLNGGTLNAVAFEPVSGQSFALKGTVTVNGNATSTISGQGIALGAGTVTGTTFVVNDGAAATDLQVTGGLRNGAGVNWPTAQASFLTKNGTGVMELAGASTYTGTTTVNAGTLRLSGSNASTSYGIAAGAVLDINQTDTGTLRTFSGGTYTGSGTLRKTGAGTFSWRDAAAINLDSSAVVDVKEGTLQASWGANQIWTSNQASLNIAAGAEFDVDAAAARFGGLTGDGTVRLGLAGPSLPSQKLTIGVANASSTFSGSIVNGTATTAPLEKVGTGTIRFTGTNTYTGTTTVSAGTLAINGNNSAATGVVTVASGATLVGSGTIGGQIIVSSGGTLAPGNSPGLLTANNGVSLATGSTFQWELINSTTDGRGTNYDAVNVTGGSLSIGTGVTSSLVFNASGSSVSWADSFWGSDRSWLVFDNTNSPTLASGAVFDTINLSADSLGATLASVRTNASFAWNQQGSDVYLSYTAVPEPSTYALLVLAAAALGFHALRRRRRA